MKHVDHKGPKGRLDMSQSRDSKRRKVDTLLLGVVLLSLPGTGLLTLLLTSSGLSAKGGGTLRISSGGAPVFLIGSALAFAASAATLYGRRVASSSARRRGYASSGNTGARAFKLADYLIVTVVAGSWIGFMVPFVPLFLLGGTISDGPYIDTLLVVSGITCCLALLFGLCRWMIWPLVKSFAARVENPERQRPPPRGAAPPHA